MTIQVGIAGRIIELHLLYDKTCSFFSDYLIKGNKKSPDLIIHNSFEDLLIQQEITKRGTVISNEGNEIHFFNLARHEFYAIYQKIAEEMIAFDTFLMHGAAIGMNEYGYMFTAASGTGKTTRAKMWMEQFPQSYIINGDKPLIRITDSEAIVCGTPWCGKEGWNTNIMLPLRAIFMLERTQKNEKSSIQKIGKGAAFPLLYQQTYHPTKESSQYKTLKLLQSLEDRVTVYRFRSDLSNEAIRLAYETARY